MLVLRGPAPNLDPGPFLGPQNPNPRTPNPEFPNPEPQTQNPKPQTQNPQTQNPKPRTPNPKHQNRKFSGPKTEVISILKNAWFKGSGAKSGPWAFFGAPKPQTQNPKPRTPNPEPQNPKFSGPKTEVISILKNAWFEGSGAKSGPWAFFGVPKLSKKQLCLAKVSKKELLKQAVPC